MRYRLRTLLIVVAFTPPLLVMGWYAYFGWKLEHDRRVAIERELGRINASIAVWKKRPGPQQQAVLSQLENRAQALERRKVTP